ncbi:hypothetical protein F4556_006602 [Kitasatospora gansuensis]|uniref:Uncharacterized protein n=1 Tax=Kitasatospora gansuensis TaxID=258050 RepID=A0A7W7SJ42_9ACTN|nr:hypothetical protein [Kitasatospora gansuensis]MBB4951067.1 hypothetical protein [Kitasatospora gansuensis]
MLLGLAAASGVGDGALELGLGRRDEGAAQFAGRADVGDRVVDVNDEGPYSASGISVSARVTSSRLAPGGVR